MKRTLGAGMIALLALTACGGTEATPEPSTSTEAAPPKPYDQLIELINTETRTNCDPDTIEELELIEDPSIQWDSISCTGESYAFYAHSEAAVEYLLEEIENNGVPPEEAVYGDDWVYLGSAAQAQSVGDALEGKHPFEEGFEISCSAGLGDESEDFDTFEDAWELDPADRLSCQGSWKHSPESEAADFHEYTDMELEALEVSGYEEQSHLKYLHSTCAEAYLGKDDEHHIELGGDGLGELNGALALCPNHPEREEAERRIAESAEVHEQREDGTRFAGGPHRVGEDIQPGTYVTEDDDGFDSCYWARLDSSGNIIQNNLIRSGFRAEVTIQQSDYSFSAEGCGEWVKQ